MTNLYGEFEGGSTNSEIHMLRSYVSSLGETVADLLVRVFVLEQADEPDQ